MFGIFISVAIKNHITIITNTMKSGFLYGILTLCVKRKVNDKSKNAAIKKKKQASFLYSPKKERPSKELKGIKNTPRKKIVAVICSNVIFPLFKEIFKVDFKSLKINF